MKNKGAVTEKAWSRTWHSSLKPGIEHNPESKKIVGGKTKTKTRNIVTFANVATTMAWAYKRKGEKQQTCKSGGAAICSASW